MELQRRAGNPLEFIESLKIDLFPDEIYVFTPKAKYLELPNGSSPVDFAYSVHTRLVTGASPAALTKNLRHSLSSYKAVKGLKLSLAEGGRPNPDWLTFTVTSRARSAIRHELKHQQQGESVALGRKLLNRSLGQRQHKHQ